MRASRLAFVGSGIAVLIVALLPPFDGPPTASSRCTWSSTC